MEFRLELKNSPGAPPSDFWGGREGKEKPLRLGTLLFGNLFDGDWESAQLIETSYAMFTTAAKGNSQQ